jgi:hypothetical protein
MGLIFRLSLLGSESMQEQFCLSDSRLVPVLSEVLLQRSLVSMPLLVGHADGDEPGLQPTAYVPPFFSLRCAAPHLRSDRRRVEVVGMPHRVFSLVRSSQPFSECNEHCRRRVAVPPCTAHFVLHGEHGSKASLPHRRTVATFESRRFFFFFLPPLAPSASDVRMNRALRYG